MRTFALAVAVAAVGSACRPASPPSVRTSVEASAPPVAGGATGLTAAKIDILIRAEWARSSITPAAPVDDARFLRRAYLDIVGTIPPPEVVVSFALDAGADKRARIVDRLLASPAYAEHWATYWTEALIGQAQQALVDKEAFETWLRTRFAANAPWNQLVTELLTAQGVSSEGGPGYGGPSDGGGSTPMLDDRAAGTDGPVNGAVNWFVKYRDTPQDLAGSASRIFLGVQIQCAQCHDHKTEKWKQEDFRDFASCFVRARTEVLDKGKMGGRKRVDVVDIGRPLPRFLKNPELAVFAQAAPRALDGTDLSKSPDPRQALAAWMTSPENPWFSEATVNRIWAHFLGRGFVNPIDDIRPSNPASAPEVLASVSSDFQAGGYDLKRLIRLITGTQAYQLSSSMRLVGSAIPAERDTLWSRFRLEPLGPEELLNALMDATGVEATLGATGKVDVQRIRSVLFAAYSYLFDVDEEFDQTDFEGTVSQALALLNGRLVGGGTSDVVGSAIDRILAQPDSDKDKIEALYLRTVSRRPTPEESEYFVRYVNEPHLVDVDPAGGRQPIPRLRAVPRKGEGGKKGTPNLEGPDPLGRLEQRDARTVDPKRRAFEDVFWALLNSSEFTFNH